MTTRPDTPVADRQYELNHAAISGLSRDRTAHPGEVGEAGGATKPEPPATSRARRHERQAHPVVWHPRQERVVGLSVGIAVSPTIARSAATWPSKASRPASVNRARTLRRPPLRRRSVAT